MSKSETYPLNKDNTTSIYHHFKLTLITQKDLLVEIAPCEALFRYSSNAKILCRMISQAKTAESYIKAYISRNHIPAESGTVRFCIYNLNFVISRYL